MGFFSKTPKQTIPPVVEVNKLTKIPYHPPIITKNINFSCWCDFDKNIQKNEFTSAIFIISVTPGKKILYLSPCFKPENNAQFSGYHNSELHPTYGNFAIENQDGSLEKIDISDKYSFSIYGRIYPAPIYGFFNEFNSSGVTPDGLKSNVVYVGFAYHKDMAHMLSQKYGDELRRQLFLLAKNFGKIPPPPLSPEEQKRLDEKNNKIKEEQERIKKEKEIKAQEKFDQEERARLARENEAYAKRLEIERDAEVELSHARIMAIRHEADAKDYKEQSEAQALERRLKIELDAIEKQNTLMKEQLEVRERIESQDIKGSTDTVAQLMGLLNRKKGGD